MIENNKFSLQIFLLYLLDYYDRLDLDKIHIDYN
jgi:hypothetical protein